MDEINAIVDFYESKPVAAQDYWSKNKNLEYQIVEDFSYKLLHPRLESLLGEHEFATGAYKECVNPYGLHVDSYQAHCDTDSITTFSSSTKHNSAFLIPLVEGHCYKTVTFKCYSSNNNFESLMSQWSTHKNNLNLDEFPHESSRIDQLPVDVEYVWQLGDILSWDRNQLHISSDFRRFGVTKKFLIMFIA